MIKIVDIKKAFGENEVIKGITTTFETGKCNLIIGRSGAGKTVLLKILVGLIQPDQGEIWFDDELIREDGFFLPSDLQPLNEGLSRAT